MTYKGPHGTAVDTQGTLPTTPGRRVAVFAQQRRLLDIVETDLLIPAGVLHMRLDGRYGLKEVSIGTVLQHLHAMAK